MKDTHLIYDRDYWLIERQYIDLDNSDWTYEATPKAQDASYDVPIMIVESKLYIIRNACT